MTDSVEFGLGPTMLRAVASRVEEIWEGVGYDGEYLPDGDWRWDLQVRVSVADFTVGFVRAHPDGYMAMFFDEGEK